MKNKILIVLYFVFLSVVKIHAQFRPFSYEEMVAPLEEMQRFHDQCCETLLQLMNNSQQVESYIIKDKDPITWDRYKTYYNSIENEYNNINSYGVNQYTSANINQLRKDFSIINGIVQAYNRRQALSIEQYKRVQNSPNLVYNQDYGDISLDDFLDGNTPNIRFVLLPTGHFSRYADGNKILINFPPFQSNSSDKNIVIKEIILSNVQTTIKFHYTSFYYGGWCNISPNCCIIVNGKKFKLKRVIGIMTAPLKNNFTSWGETLDFSLIFPAIPKNTKYIDFFESSNSEWNMTKIELR